MLVTFSCDAYENITLFGHVAVNLLKMMGQSGVVPTAILAEDAKHTLSQLEKALARETPPSSHTVDEDDDEVSLSKRAVPILALLRAAVKAHVDVMVR